MEEFVEGVLWSIGMCVVGGSNSWVAVWQPHFFCLEAFNMPFDTRWSHRLARTLCKVCFKGYVSLLYPHQPAGTSVPFACLRCIPLYTMIGMDTVYCILYTIYFWSLGDYNAVEVLFCVCV